MRNRSSGSVNVTVRASKSTLSTLPRIACTPRSVLASGIATKRASTTPPATSGSSGVQSM
jgi:hypothetical protein